MDKLSIEYMCIIGNLQQNYMVNIANSTVFWLFLKKLPRFNFIISQQIIKIIIVLIWNILLFYNLKPYRKIIIYPYLMKD